MSDKWDIWTRNFRPEWLRNNADIPDMRLIYGLELAEALAMMRRLFEMYGDSNLRVINSSYDWSQGWPRLEARGTFSPLQDSSERV